MDIIICSTIIALILLVWFRTDAWLEYCRVFGLNWLSFYKDYDLKYKEDVSLTYLHYLRRDHNCFFVRLITCPICLSIWLGLIPLLILPVLLIPACVLLALIIFTTVDRLLG